MTIEQASKLAKQKLSVKRYKHVSNVADAAITLARRYGVDPQKAALAAWLHDIVKEQSKEELLQILGQDAIIAQSTLERPLPVWHGPAGALFAKQHGVDDPDILSAIECHTTGKKDMSIMDKVLFLSDVISAERSHPGVARLRALAREDLDAAVIAAMEDNIIYLNNKGKPLDIHTVQALEWLQQQRSRGSVGG